MGRFWRFELRTTHVEQARAFYASILGPDRSSISQLGEHAVARGARPHWLGQIDVDDVEQAATAFELRGATRLGPKSSPGEAGRVAVLRDPGGAIVALSSACAPPNAGLDLALCVLNTSDAKRVAADYSELFGWYLTEQKELGSIGRVDYFAWERMGRNAGVIADIQGRSGVHPHWLFFFEVDALELSLDKVRAAHGKVVDLPEGPMAEHYAVCEDPQGAAFGLHRRLRGV